ncbi:hypothetical protein SKAU_G00199660 [Synaphobranchus kaupii]|uniref:Uncharacterized protein n=1 Tax=Synaphobranchus kaupii TaxID=118154 RepID=A0A9Q1IVZ1_SYNKA|nr:hypothetical protein SKAU_G00199660 [Synaphobranchus kaupii]
MTWGLQRENHRVSERERAAGEMSRDSGEIGGLPRETACQVASERPSPPNPPSPETVWENQAATGPGVPNGRRS